MDIVKYVRKYQSDFSKRPLNQADSLILCELSYLNFNRSVAGSPRKTLRQLIASESESLITDTLLPQKNARLLKAIESSKRFADVKVGFFRQRNNRTTTRFAAVTFVLPDGTAYVAFRGTDITLLGWKEDFNMACYNTVPSQPLSQRYLCYVASKLDGNIIVGGHSKGGNLAVYAAAYASEDVQKRIVAVYNHDGPGFNRDIYSQSGYKAVSDRIYKTVPHDSVIGMLLAIDSNYNVVECRSVSVAQHDPFNWNVTDEHGFKILPKTTEISQITDRAMRRWLDEMDVPSRRRFVNALFKIVYGSGATTVLELRKHPASRVKGMKQAYDALPPQDKKLLAMYGKELIALWFKVLFNRPYIGKKPVSSE